MAPSRRVRFARVLSLVLSVAAAHASAAEDEVIEKGVTHRPVAAEQLPNVPGHSLTAVVVDFAPGGLSPPHRHPGFVFAYVLSGTIRSRLGDGPVVDYHAGQSWVEPPGTLHSLTQNPSPSEAASLLAVWVNEDGAELLVPP
jgi:quercetin dioxygenase-like cupin family protein